MAVMCICFKSEGIMGGNLDAYTLRVLQSAICSCKQNLT